jgi:hypothetical protein
LNKDAIIANLDNPFYTSAKESILVNTVPQFRNAINKGLALGQSYPEMMADIKKVVNGKNFEIMRVLVTELHNSQEAGTADSYDEALEQGVNGKVVWIATLDDRTREDHQQMDGVVRDEDGMFRGAVGETPYPGWEGMEAAERINCIPADAIPIGVDVEKLYRRWYEGKLIHIKTASGLDLRVTPNHPVLTDQGWIAAHLLDKGHNLVSVVLGQVVNMLDVDIDHRPPMASKIFNLFRIASIEKRVLGRNSQFHGDGRDGDVDVESINSKLWNSFQSVFYKPLIKRVFSHTNILKRLLSGNGAFNKCRFATLYATHCIMRFVGKLRAFFRRCLGHPEIHSIGTITGFDAIPKKYFANSPSINLELFSSRLFGESFKIETDNIIFVSEDDFSGHVYNLQSKYDLYGLYNNNGRMSIVHNCRCDIRFEIEGFEPTIRRSREDGIVPYQTYDTWKEDKQTFK